MGHGNKSFLLVRYLFGVLLKDRRSCILYVARHLTTKENKEKKHAAEVTFPSKYKPKDVETDRYSWWMKHNCFSSVKSHHEPFSILLPPPNITGTLHLGHALTTTIQDVFTRWYRMHGVPVLWIPGMDHAGIATQMVVEKMLWQKGKTRHDIGRKRFCEEVTHWKEKKKCEIRDQLQKLGASLDWSREFFTMDSKQSTAVVEAFIQLYRAGLIYRSESLVNWSCSLQSAISDIEVSHQLVEGPTKIHVPDCEELVEFGVLHNFAYRICGKDGEVIVSTTRIETMLGDVAVAVHPEDCRYKHLHGVEVWHPFRKVKIPVVTDHSVDPEFGTGAVKVTPAHDRIDFEISKRHNLPVLHIISENGKLNENCGELAGTRRFDARKLIITELEKMNLMRGSKDHKMHIPVCSRSGDVVELILKPQWYINCQEMAEKAVVAVKDGRLKIEPHCFEKTWFTYLENIRDWCISRQLWWGHQIPLYKCQVAHNDNSSWIAARNVDEAQKSATNILGCDLRDVTVTQDEDVLDTWFSSALLPFSALGWPYQSEDMKMFYPLSTMVTGNDILFFWVARMVMLGGQLTEQLPFKKIFLHGIICDAHGRKMSKSLGNVIHPEHVSNGISLKGLQDEACKNLQAGILSENEFKKTVEGQKKLFASGIPECGTDALRFSLLTQNVQNTYLNFDVSNCHSNRLLCNKIWQACRYVHMFRENVGSTVKGDAIPCVSICDRWILSRLAAMVKILYEALNSHQLHHATASLRAFIYTDFCDTYLETTKPLLKNGRSMSAQAACWTLMCCTDTFLRALSPFMPFLAESLYHHLHLSAEDQPLMLTPYPKPDQLDRWHNKDLESEFSKAISAVSIIRQIKALCEIRNQKLQVYIVSSSHEQQLVFEKFKDVIITLADCESVTIACDVPMQYQETCISENLSHNCSVFIILERSQIREKINVHINKKYQKVTSELQKLLKVTSAHGYKSKAAVSIQEQHAEKIKDLQAKLTTLKQIQKSLGKIECKLHEMEK